MTSNEDQVIFFLQLSAAILMGFDYFLSDTQRKKMETKIISFFSKFKKGIDKDIKELTNSLRAKAFIIIVGTITSMLGATVLFLGSNTELSQTIGSAVNVASFMLIAIGVIMVADPILRLAFQGGTAITLLILTTWILSSPKGPVAAIGMTSLMMSFAIQYAYI